MKKKLPTLKKSLIDFATKEDAKVMDKAFTKVALVGSAVSLGAMDAFAGDVISHANTLTIPNTNEADQSYPSGYKTSNAPQDDHAARNKLYVNTNLYNSETSGSSTTVTNLPEGRRDADGTDNVDVPAQSVVAHHANHYNRVPKSDSGNC